MRLSADEAGMNANNKRACLPTRQESSRIKYPLLIIVLTYIIGIILGHLLDLPFPFLFLTLTFLLLSFFLSFKRGNLTLSTIFLILSLILSGFLYHKLFVSCLTPSGLDEFLGKKVEIIGTVSSFPEAKEERTSFALKTEEINGEGMGSRIEVSIFHAKDFYREAEIKKSSFQYGDRIRFRGRLERPPTSRNPKGFDYRSYLLGRKIPALVYLREEEIEILGREGGNPLSRVGLFFRQHLMETIDQTLPSLQGGVLKGILLGRRGELPPEIEKDFIDTGVVHVLAVSGLHVGLITFIFGAFFAILRLPKRISALLLILIIFLYALMVGPRPSILRASIMFGIGTLAYYLQRKRELYNSLALAALILLLINPLFLFNIGFQLSFIAVLSILYLYPRIWPKLKFLSHYLGGLMAVSLAAWIGVAPLIAYHFNYFTPVALLANLFVVPLVTIVVALGFLAAIFSFFLPLAQLFSHANWLFLTLLVKAVNFFNYFPGAGIRVITPSLFFIGFYYLGIVGLINFRRSPLIRKVVFIGTLCLIAFFIWGNIFTPQSDLLKVTFLDVGQGDSIFVQFPDKKNMLIDGGSGRYDTLPPYLWDQRIRRIDYLISTHPHTDHLGGLIGVLSNFRVGGVIESGQEHTSFTCKKFLEIMKEKKIPYRIARAGQKLESNQNNIRIDILHPQEELIEYGGSQLNNNSIVVKLTYGKVSFLFTADIEKEAEGLLVKKYGLRLKSTILKVPHQGSKTSSTLKFLEKVSPECAIISVGARNPFGHPHPEVLKRFQNLGIKVYRADEEGAVVITTDGRDYWVNTMREKQRLGK